MASTKIVQKNNNHILYDASVISKPSDDLFKPEWYEQESNIEQIGQHSESDSVLSMGRGAAWFVTYNQRQWVLKHYKRGGMVAKWNKEYYFGMALSNTRAWKEWYFLNSLHSIGLPVPKPVSACVSWPFGRVLGIYKAAIIIDRITGAMTLAEKCQHKKMDQTMWSSVGKCIRKFHAHGVYHSDLNANNILFDQNDNVFLIDFDKGCIRSSGAWEQENLSRLQRSLLKLQGMHDGFSFSDEEWGELMEGYDG